MDFLTSYISLKTHAFQLTHTFNVSMSLVFNENTEFLVDIATIACYLAIYVPKKHETQYQTASSSTTRFLP